MSQVDMDSLDVSVVGKRVFAEFPADTRLLEAAEWDLGVKLVHAVDPCGSGLQLMRNTDGAIDVLGEDSSCETVNSIVCLLDNICLIFEFDNNANRAEDLFLDDPHVGVGVGENGRLNKESLFSVTLSTYVDGGAFLLARVNVFHDAVVLDLRDLWSLIAVYRKWISDFERLYLLSEQLQEFVVDRSLDEDS